MHTWDQDEVDCPIKSNDGNDTVHKHFMRCSTCGIRRHGGYAEYSNYHYFEYSQPGGHQSEYIPPCSTPPDPSIGVVDELQENGKKSLFCRALKFIDAVKSRHARSNT
ncbi:hypothetical protein IT407_00235 [Candidatus Uhrbacteria bacterium]|nr:hypothetical protein [Candidatus Uhrbacteria bacterium]